ncbi:hypothetical protein [Prochlorococcus sp. MIT 1312]
MSEEELEAVNGGTGCPGGETCPTGYPESTL